jgi:hypothetical protein
MANLKKTKTKTRNSQYLAQFLISLFSDASIMVSAEVREMELAERQQREKLSPGGGGGRQPYKNRSDNPSGSPNNPPVDQPMVRMVDPTEGQSQSGRDQIRY